MRNNLGAVAIVLATLVGCATRSAYAQPRNGRPGPRVQQPAAPGAPRAAPAPRPAQPGPNLTAKQREQMQQLRLANYDKIAPLKRDLMAKRGELQILWATPQPNRDAILRKQVEMDAVRQKIREARVEERIARLKLLTPEQRAALPSRGGEYGWDYQSDRKDGCPRGERGNRHGGGRGRGWGMGPRQGQWE
jgi:Spy/CpxP family protein refolding chaperone